MHEDRPLVAVCATGEIMPGEIRPVPGFPILVCRSGDSLYAVAAVCPHSGALLKKGSVVEDCLECPLHGARFALADGRIRRGPSSRRLATYPVIVTEGDIFVSTRPHPRRTWWSR
ncbi:Rieske (2Fe-2S) protein [Actinocorallia longicatena]|uniref:Rieske domain-containing protein n=1 Tax=Actinocorallia longicatena TaxID=111803 RepID=A0ABP6Q916_9ACTN